MIILKKEECYCDLITFYENVTKKIGVQICENTNYDCRKICITKQVQDEIWKFYKEIENAEDVQIGILLACYGAKAILEYDGFAAEVEQGFATERNG